ncbi:hypothetical protein O181_011055 [Austropuccinia psidii MF-1]|uniref:Uncharacterized protein n=1 Tax=Austropuccinia psidii MF-1 TaxID=1389203 RepID=A0A9Q3GLI7_9BASI|nr:hypothetical protein [Austropuccinia psidii MF-1]
MVVLLPVLASNLDQDKIWNPAIHPKLPWPLRLFLLEMSDSHQMAPWHPHPSPQVRTGWPIPFQGSFCGHLTCFRLFILFHRHAPHHIPFEDLSFPSYHQKISLSFKKPTSSE